MDKFTRIKEIIAEVSENNSVLEKVTLTCDLIEDAGLDSLEFINLILGLEEEFDLQIDMEEIDLSELTTIEGLISYIEKVEND